MREYTNSSFDSVWITGITNFSICISPLISSKGSGIVNSLNFSQPSSVHGFSAQAYTKKYKPKIVRYDPHAWFNWNFYPHDWCFL